MLRRARQYRCPYARSDLNWWIVIGVLAQVRAAIVGTSHNATSSGASTSQDEGSAQTLSGRYQFGPYVSVHHLQRGVDERGIDMGDASGTTMNEKCRT